MSGVGSSLAAKHIIFLNGEDREQRLKPTVGEMTIHRNDLVEEGTPHDGIYGEDCTARTATRF